MRFPLTSKAIIYRLCVIRFMMWRFVPTCSGNNFNLRGLFCAEVDLQPTNYFIFRRSNLESDRPHYRLYSGNIRQPVQSFIEQVPCFTSGSRCPAASSVTVLLQKPKSHNSSEKRSKHMTRSTCIILSALLALPLLTGTH